MGLSKIRIGAPALVAAVLLATGAFQAAAQTFGGMSMLDVEAERDSFFQSADADGDFALSNDEQMSAIDRRHAKLLECWDDDGDGLCSYSEFLESGQKLFSEPGCERRRRARRRTKFNNFNILVSSQGFTSGSVRSGRGSHSTPSQRRNPYA